LRKYVFVWSDEVLEAFGHLKEVVTQPPILALPNLNKLAAVEYV
jgi:hypothetical protein